MAALFVDVPGFQVTVLYKNVVQACLHPTDATTAEVVKVVENTYRDVNIDFANEVVLICRSMAVDPGEARVAILGFAFLEDSDDHRNTPTISLFD